MTRAAVLGGSGYAGAELLRILAGHPGVEVSVATSEKSAGKPVTDVFPHLGRYSSLVFEPLVPEAISEKADVFLMALPHGASQEAVHSIFEKGKKVIDLSADFRLSDPDVYETWYKTPHRFRHTLGKAVYGLPELHRAKIKKAALVANPGCYPTGALLGLYPLLKAKLVPQGPVIIDSKSGVSGAGRKPETPFLFCEVNEALRAYNVGVHRHTPEIEQEASLILGKAVSVDFTPHLVPMDRGILTTIYVRVKGQAETKGLLSLFAKTYSKEPFVRLLEEGKYPNVKHVRGTNYAEIGLFANKKTGTTVVLTAIDNLVKGAAGLAVENMNLMMGFEETEGLRDLALFP